MTDKDSQLKEWPAKGEVLSFDDLIGPLRDAVSQIYELRRINSDKDVDYKGYNIGKDSLVCSFSPDEAMTAKNLAYDLEEQGRDAMSMVLGIAIQLGIEQGKRLAMRDLKTDFDMIKMAHDMCRPVILRLTNDG